jgi:hypothetical protein
MNLNEPFTGPPPRSCELCRDPRTHDRSLRDRLVGVLFTRTGPRSPPARCGWATR